MLNLNFGKMASARRDAIVTERLHVARGSRGRVATVSTRRYETTRNEVSKMKKFISANEEIVHKQDAEIRRLASMIRRMDDDARSRRFTKVPSLRCDSWPSETALGVFFPTFEALRTPNRARMHSKSQKKPLSWK